MHQRIMVVIFIIYVEQIGVFIADKHHKGRRNGNTVPVIIFIGFHLNIMGIKHVYQKNIPAFDHIHFIPKHNGSDMFILIFAEIKLSFIKIMIMIALQIFFGGSSFYNTVITFIGIGV